MYGWLLRIESEVSYMLRQTFYRLSTSLSNAPLILGGFCLQRPEAVALPPQQLEGLTAGSCHVGAVQLEEQPVSHFIFLLVCICVCGWSVDISMPLEIKGKPSGVDSSVGSGIQLKLSRLHLHCCVILPACFCFFFF